MIHLVVMPLHAFFNIAILSTTTLLAGDYFRSLQRPYLTDLLADQHLGAGVGWAMGELPMLIVVIAIGVQWMRSDEREAGRFDRKADRAEAGDAGVEDELSAYNRHLQSLHARDQREAEQPSPPG